MRPFYIFICQRCRWWLGAVVFCVEVARTWAEPLHRGHSHFAVWGAAGEDCGGQLLAQVMWTQISVWKETSLSPVVPPKAMGELPGQPEPEKLILERQGIEPLFTCQWKENKETTEREYTSVQLETDYWAVMICGHWEAKSKYDRGCN